MFQGEMNSQSIEQQSLLHLSKLLLGVIERIYENKQNIFIAICSFSFTLLMNDFSFVSLLFVPPHQNKSLTKMETQKSIIPDTTNTLAYSCEASMPEQQSGSPDWAIFCQLGYFWRLIMIFGKDEVTKRFGLIFAYGNLLHFHISKQFQNMVC